MTLAAPPFPDSKHIDQAYIQLVWRIIGGITPNNAILGPYTKREQGGMAWGTRWEHAKVTAISGWMHS